MLFYNKEFGTHTSTFIHAKQQVGQTEKQVNTN